MLVRLIALVDNSTVRAFAWISCFCLGIGADRIFESLMAAARQVSTLSYPLPHPACDHHFTAQCVCWKSLSNLESGTPLQNIVRKVQLSVSNDSCNLGAFWPDLAMLSDVCVSTRVRVHCVRTRSRDSCLLQSRFRMLHLLHMQLHALCQAQLLEKTCPKSRNKEG